MASETQTVPTENLPPQTASRFVNALMILAVVVIAFLLFYRLSEYPIPWYDEGSHLHVAKNFALNGIYADYSSEGVRYYGPAVGVGPTVMLPIALLFKIFGVSIPLARLVITAYSLLALLACYALGTRFLTPRQAFLAVVVMALSPGVDFLYNGRTVLGEVPGIFFIMAGLWLWLRPGKLGLPSLIGVGVLMGLACITKNQYALFVLPSLLLAFIADLVWYRRRGWLYFVVPGLVAGLMFAAWTYIVLIALGQKGNLADNLATLRTASAGVFFLFKIYTLKNALGFLVDSKVYSGLFIPVFVYAALLSLPRTEKGQQTGIVFIFIAAASGLFVSSLAWPRYAFPALVLIVFFVIHLIARVTNEFQIHWRELFKQPMDFSGLIAMLAIGWLVVMLILPVFTHVYAINQQASSDSYKVADYLKANVPKEAVIETWEQELAVLTDNTYHYPPQIVLAQSVAEQWLNGPAVTNSYDFRDSVKPDYVVVGPFGQYTRLYPPERLSQFDLVTTIGPYQVYKHKS
jgi:4-amino-4-deoxy-L-arabinose transferase-like glycosyltransferase